MLEDQPQLDTLAVAIGGGGLISGIATAAKALKPGIEIVGVQTERFPSMYAALKGVTMPQGPYTIAEGIAVKSPGDITREVAGRLVDRIELVSESDIEHAIVVLLEIEKSVVEGAGAAGWRCCAPRKRAAIATGASASAWCSPAATSTR